MSWEVHRLSNYGRTLVKTFRWHWLARFYAWEHTTRGWFKYVVISTDSPHSVAGFDRRWAQARALRRAASNTGKERDK